MEFFIAKKKKRIHLDYASATPVHADVYKTMQPYVCDMWANPSALYAEGVAVREVIENSRERLARVLCVRPGDVTFTSGGTEANNLALIGAVGAQHKKGRAYTDIEIIATRIEHPSIMETLAYLAKRGVVVTYVPVDNEGLVDIQVLETLLNTKTVLVTFAYVNSEVGVIQEVKKITRMVRKWNEAHSEHVLVHTDASQAPLWLPCALDMLGVDMMTLDAGKCYGPKGVGVLVHRQWVEIVPVVFGGGQEAGLRSGTESVPLIVGCVTALLRAQKEWQSRSTTVALLRDRFITLLSTIPGIVLNGSATLRVANNVNISIPGLDTEYAVIWLDAKGIAASTKSACGAQGSTGSYVVREMTHDEARATATLRFTLGEETTETDIVTATTVLASFAVRMHEDSREATSR
ncbi:cysteine desulfurase [Candidatus Kaiserbacteria bacterium]|nr:MAG: cysteine desulfurase [Candidatus Kaiserbacteria bacterium]